MRYDGVTGVGLHPQSPCCPRGMLPIDIHAFVSGTATRTRRIGGWGRLGSYIAHRSYRAVKDLSKTTTRARHQIEAMISELIRINLVQSQREQCCEAFRIMHTCHTKMSAKCGSKKQRDRRLESSCAVVRFPSGFLVERVLPEFLRVPDRCFAYRSVCVRAMISLTEAYHTMRSDICSQDVCVAKPNMSVNGPTSSLCRGAGGRLAARLGGRRGPSVTSCAIGYRGIHLVLQGVSHRPCCGYPSPFPSSSTSSPSRGEKSVAGHVAECRRQPAGAADNRQGV